MMFLILRASSSSTSSLPCRCFLRSNGGKFGRLISSSNLEQSLALRWRLPSTAHSAPVAWATSIRASIPSLGHLSDDFVVRCSSTSSSGGNDDNNTKNGSDADEAKAESAVSTPKLLFDADDDARQYFLSSDEDNNNSSSSSAPSSAQASAAQLPPSYIRDAVTGKWTDKTRAELSIKDKQLLNLDEESKSEEVMKRLEKRWREAASYSSVKEGGAAGTGNDDGLGTLNSEHERIARRIQEMQLALGPIGRDPAYYSSSSSTKGENTVANTAMDNQQLPLTPREYQALKTYAQKEYKIDPQDFVKLVSDGNTSATTTSSSNTSSSSNQDSGLDDLIPHNTLSSGPDHALLAQSNKQYFDADLDLAYLNPKLHRRAFKDEGGYQNSSMEDPLADILPSDLNPTRKVNRRHAQPIPKRLLHHNNLSLLRRYTTPGGKIMNRVQSRLGAKDQRKIARLVKRARHLGLIPHMGQWKFEDHGYLYERGVVDVDGQRKTMNGVGDNETKKAWEIELEQRGLWPLQDDTEIIKKYYDLEAILDHVGGPKGSKKRETLDRLLGGPGALV